MNLTRLNRRECSLKLSNRHVRYSDNPLWALLGHQITCNAREAIKDRCIYDVTSRYLNGNKHEISNYSTTMDKLGLN